jgi:uncharacterized protein YkwD
MTDCGSRSGRRRPPGVSRVRPSAAAAAWAPLLLCAALAATGSTTLAQAVLEASYRPLPPHPLEARLLALTNDARVGAGRSGLVFSEVLAQAARYHAVEMAELGYFSHRSPDPASATVSDRVVNAGGSMVRVGENIASHGSMTLDAAEQAVRGWVNSPGPRENLVHSAFTHVGFGVHEHGDGRVYIVQVFADFPNPLVFAHASVAPSTRVSLRLGVLSDAPGFVSVWAGPDLVARAQVGSVSRSTLDVHGISGIAPTRIQLGWAASAGEGAITQSSGWFDPATGQLTLDYESGYATSRILRYAVSADARSTRWSPRTNAASIFHPWRWQTRRQIPRFNESPGANIDAWPGERRVHR